MNILFTSILLGYLANFSGVLTSRVPAPLLEDSLRFLKEGFKWIQESIIAISKYPEGQNTSIALESGINWSLEDDFSF